VFVGCGWPPPPLTSTTTLSDAAVKLRSSCATAWFEIRCPEVALERTCTEMLIVTGWLFCACTKHVTTLPAGVHEPLVALAPSTSKLELIVSRTATVLALALLLKTVSV